MSIETQSASHQGSPKPFSHLGYRRVGRALQVTAVLWGSQDGFKPENKKAPNRRE